MLGEFEQMPQLHPALRGQDIDIFVFGPPCRPYTVLSSCRKDADYNPLQAKDSQPFVKGSRWIRVLAWQHFDLT